MPLSNMLKKDIKYPKLSKAMKGNTNVRGKHWKLSEETKEKMKGSLTKEQKKERSKLRKNYLKKYPEKHNWYKDGRSIKRTLKYKEKIAGRKKPEQCEVCGAFDTICFDHDHQTGNFRGWICHRCNFALGLVKDNSELLIALAKYLKDSN